MVEQSCTCRLVACCGLCNTGEAVGVEVYESSVGATWPTTCASAGQFD